MTRIRHGAKWSPVLSRLRHAGCRSDWTCVSVYLSVSPEKSSHFQNSMWSFFHPSALLSFLIATLATDFFIYLSNNAQECCRAKCYIYVICALHVECPQWISLSLFLLSANWDNISSLKAFKFLYFAQLDWFSLYLYMYTHTVTPHRAFLCGNWMLFPCSGCVCPGYMSTLCIPCLLHKYVTPLDAKWEG